jgi:flagellar motor component MotA
MDKNDFVKEYRELVQRVLFLTEIALREGMLKVEEMIDQEKLIQRDILECGLKFACDGYDDWFIDRLLTNIIEQETDENKKLLGNIQKGAVLGIQEGMSQSRILILLNSFVNIDVEDTMRKFNELEKLAIKEMKVEEDGT